MAHERLVCYLTQSLRIGFPAPTRRESYLSRGEHTSRDLANLDERPRISRPDIVKASKSALGWNRDRSSTGNGCEKMDRAATGTAQNCRLIDIDEQLRQPDDTSNRSVALPSLMKHHGLEGQSGPL